eukprot:7115748-Alexandrium_andersonii.AAC.1
MGSETSLPLQDLYKAGTIKLLDPEFRPTPAEQERRQKSWTRRNGTSAIGVNISKSVFWVKSSAAPKCEGSRNV